MKAWLAGSTSARSLSYCKFFIVSSTLYLLNTGWSFLPQEVHTISWRRDFVTVRLAPIALCDACMSCFCDHAGTRAFRKAGFGSYGFVFSFLRRRSILYFSFFSFAPQPAASTSMEDYFIICNGYCLFATKAEHRCLLLWFYRPPIFSRSLFTRCLLHSVVEQDNCRAAFRRP